MPAIQGLTLKKAKETYKALDKAYEKSVNLYLQSLTDYLQPLLKEHYGISQEKAKPIISKFTGTLLDAYSFNNHEVTDNIISKFTDYFHETLDNHSINSDKEQLKNMFAKGLSDGLLPKPDQFVSLEGQIKSYSTLVRNKGFELRYVPEGKRWNELTRNQLAEYKDFINARNQLAEEIKEQISVEGSYLKESL